MVIVQGHAFYSLAEIAELLGISKRTLCSWIEKPEMLSRAISLNPVTQPNGRKFFREQEVVAVLSACWGVNTTPESLRQRFAKKPKGAG